MQRRGGFCLALLLGLFLAACGSSNGSSSPNTAAARSRVRDAIQRTEAAGTAHLVTDVNSRTSFGQHSASKAAESDVTIVGDIRFAGPDVSTTTTNRLGGSSSIYRGKEIHIGSKIYIQQPGPGNEWVLTPERQPFTLFGRVVTKALATAQGPVTTVGQKEVDGQATTEYLVHVPDSLQVTRLSKPINGQYLQRYRTEPYVIYVWLDGAGRIVRGKSTLFSTISDEPGSSDETIITTLSKFGEAVHIEAPSLPPSS
jgi:hypothetical protein